MADTDHVLVRERLTNANELKLEGNVLFKASKWTEAIVSYKTALNQLPPRKKSSESDTDQVDATESPAQSEDATPAVPEIQSELALECAKARAVLYANIGACLSKLEDHKGVVDACTQALLDDPHYVKALQRRAASNEKIDTWSSLSSAQEDYKLLVDLLPVSSPELVQIKKSLRLLEPRVRAAQEKETTEMIDKLKGLGNTILGKFGLSTDNFKFEPNGQGGYSMNFVQ